MANQDRLESQVSSRKRAGHFPLSRLFTDKRHDCPWLDLGFFQKRVASPGLPIPQPSSPRLTASAELPQQLRETLALIFNMLTPSHSLDDIHEENPLLTVLSIDQAAFDKVNDIYRQNSEALVDVGIEIILLVINELEKTIKNGTEHDALDRLNNHRNRITALLDRLIDFDQKLVRALPKVESDCYANLLGSVIPCTYGSDGRVRSAGYANQIKEYRDLVDADSTRQSQLIGDFRKIGHGQSVVLVPPADVRLPVNLPAASPQPNKPEQNKPNANPYKGPHPGESGFHQQNPAPVSFPSPVSLWNSLFGGAQSTSTLPESKDKFRTKRTQPIFKFIDVENQDTDMVSDVVDARRLGEYIKSLLESKVSDMPSRVKEVWDQFEKNPIDVAFLEANITILSLYAIARYAGVGMLMAVNPLSPDGFINRLAATQFMFGEFKVRIPASVQFYGILKTLLDVDDEMPNLYTKEVSGIDKKDGPTYTLTHFQYEEENNMAWTQLSGLLIHLENRNLGAHIYNVDAKDDSDEKFGQNWEKMADDLVAEYKTAVHGPIAAACGFLNELDATGKASINTNNVLLPPNFKPTLQTIVDNTNKIADFLDEKEKWLRTEANIRLSADAQAKFWYEKAANDYAAMRDKFRAESTRWQDRINSVNGRNWDDDARKLVSEIVDRMDYLKDATNHKIIINRPRSEKTFDPALLHQLRGPIESYNLDFVGAMAAANSVTASEDALKGTLTRLAALDKQDDAKPMMNNLVKQFEDRRKKRAGKILKALRATPEQLSLFGNTSLADQLKVINMVCEEIDKGNSNNLSGLAKKIKNIIPDWPSDQTKSNARVQELLNIIRARKTEVDLLEDEFMKSNIRKAVYAKNALNACTDNAITECIAQIEAVSRDRKSAKDLTDTMAKKMYQILKDANRFVSPLPEKHLKELQNKIKSLIEGYAKAKLTNPLDTFIIDLFSKYIYNTNGKSQGQDKLNNNTKGGQGQTLYYFKTKGGTQLKLTKDELDNLVKALNPELGNQDYLNFSDENWNGSFPFFERPRVVEWPPNTYNLSTDKDYLTYDPKKFIAYAFRHQKNGYTNMTVIQSQQHYMTDTNSPGDVWSQGADIDQNVWYGGLIFSKPVEDVRRKIQDMATVIKDYPWRYKGQYKAPASPPNETNNDRTEREATTETEKKDCIEAVVRHLFEVDGFMRVVDQKRELRKAGIRDFWLTMLDDSLGDIPGTLISDKAKSNSGDDDRKAVMGFKQNLLDQFNANQQARNSGWTFPGMTRSTNSLTTQSSLKDILIACQKAGFEPDFEKLAAAIPAAEREKFLFRIGTVITKVHDAIDQTRKAAGMLPGKDVSAAAFNCGCNRLEFLANHDHRGIQLVLLPLLGTVDKTDQPAGLNYHAETSIVNGHIKSYEIRQGGSTGVEHFNRRVDLKKDLKAFQNITALRGIPTEKLTSAQFAELRSAERFESLIRDQVCKDLNLSGDFEVNRAGEELIIVQGGQQLMSNYKFMLKKDTFGFAPELPRYRIEVWERSSDKNGGELLKKFRSVYQYRDNLNLDITELESIFGHKGMVPPENFDDTRPRAKAMDDFVGALFQPKSGRTKVYEFIDSVHSWADVIRQLGIMYDGSALATRHKYLNLAKDITLPNGTSIKLADLIGCYFETNPSTVETTILKSALEQSGSKLSLDNLKSLRALWNRHTAVYDHPGTVVKDYVNRKLKVNGVDSEAGYPTEIITDIRDGSTIESHLEFDEFEEGLLQQAGMTMVRSHDLELLLSQVGHGRPLTIQFSDPMMNPLKIKKSGGNIEIREGDGDDAPVRNMDPDAAIGVLKERLSGEPYTVTFDQPVRFDNGSGQDVLKDLMENPHNLNRTISLRVPSTDGTAPQSDLGTRISFTGKVAKYWGADVRTLNIETIAYASTEGRNTQVKCIDQLRKSAKELNVVAFKVCTNGQEESYRLAYSKAKGKYCLEYKSSSSTETIDGDKALNNKLKEILSNSGTLSIYGVSETDLAPFVEKLFSDQQVILSKTNDRGHVGFLMQDIHELAGSAKFAADCKSADGRIEKWTFEFSHCQSDQSDYVVRGPGSETRYKSYDEAAAAFDAKLTSYSVTLKATIRKPRLVSTMTYAIKDGKGTQEIRELLSTPNTTMPQYFITEDAASTFWQLLYGGQVKYVPFESWGQGPGGFMELFSQLRRWAKGTFDSFTFSELGNNPLFMGVGIDPFGVFKAGGHPAGHQMSQNREWYKYGSYDHLLGELAPQLALSMFITSLTNGESDLLNPLAPENLFGFEFTAFGITGVGLLGFVLSMRNYLDSLLRQHPDTTLYDVMKQMYKIFSKESLMKMIGQTSLISAMRMFAENLELQFETTPTPGGDRTPVDYLVVKELFKQCGKIAGGVGLTGAALGFAEYCKKEYGNNILAVTDGTEPIHQGAMITLFGVVLFWGILDLVQMGVGMSRFFMGVDNAVKDYTSGFNRNAATETRRVMAHAGDSRYPRALRDHINTQIADGIKKAQAVSESDKGHIHAYIDAILRGIVGRHPELTPAFQGGAAESNADTVKKLYTDLLEISRVLMLSVDKDKDIGLALAKGLSKDPNCQPMAKVKALLATKPDADPDKTGAIFAKRRNEKLVKILDHYEKLMPNPVVRKPWYLRFRSVSSLAATGWDICRKWRSISSLDAAYGLYQASGDDTVTESDIKKIKKYLEKSQNQYLGPKQLALKVIIENWVTIHKNIQNYLASGVGADDVAQLFTKVDTLNNMQLKSMAYYNIAQQYMTLYETEKKKKPVNGNAAVKKQCIKNAYNAVTKIPMDDVLSQPSISMRKLIYEVKSAYLSEFAKAEDRTPILREELDNWMIAIHSHGKSEKRGNSFWGMWSFRVRQKERSKLFVIGDKKYINPLVRASQSSQFLKPVVKDYWKQKLIFELAACEVLKYQKSDQIIIEQQKRIFELFLPVNPLTKWAKEPESTDANPFLSDDQNIFMDAFDGIADSEKADILNRFLKFITLPRYGVDARAYESYFKGKGLDGRNLENDSKRIEILLASMPFEKGKTGTTRADYRSTANKDWLESEIKKNVPASSEEVIPPDRIIAFAKLIYRYQNWVDVKDPKNKTFLDTQREHLTAALESVINTIQTASRFRQSVDPDTVRIVTELVDWMAPAQYKAVIKQLPNCIFDVDGPNQDIRVRMAVSQWLRKTIDHPDWYMDPTAYGNIVADCNSRDLVDSILMREIQQKWDRWSEANGLPVQRAV